MMAAVLRFSCALQAVERSLQEAVALSTSQAAPLLSAPWGLHFIAHASSSALLTTSKALLQSVRFWKAANAVASTAGLARNSNSSSRGRPVLMARVLNHQNSLKDKQQQQQWKDGPSAGGVAGSSIGASMSATIKASAQAASILSRCVQCPGTFMLPRASVQPPQHASGKLLKPPFKVKASDQTFCVWRLTAAYCAQLEADGLHSPAVAL